MSQKTDKKSKSKPKELTDDELLDQCIKAKDICGLSSCDKSIKIIRIQCQLCKQDFCTSHMLPEVHGCGQAARKAASVPQKKAPKPEKVQELEKKMSSKLEKMKNERKKKVK